MISIKKDFCSKLIKELGENDYFITADLGYGVTDEIKEKLGDRFINVGVAEQCMIGIASGLALGGKRVFTYTISSFYMRALEQIKLDLYGQGIESVIMIGIGNPHSEYENFGLSHLITGGDIVLLSHYREVVVIDDIVKDVHLAINNFNMILLPR